MERISPAKEIHYISTVIEKNILYYEKIGDKGFLCENILSQLRNLIEDVMIFIYSTENGYDLDCNYNNVGDSKDYISKNTSYNFIANFHNHLQKIASHYTPSEDNAIKLVEYYLNLICEIKQLLKEKFNLDIIDNLFMMTQLPRKIMIKYVK